jgi:hypothetical protein
VAIADACVAAMGGVAEFLDKTVELDDERAPMTSLARRSVPRESRRR